MSTKRKNTDQLNIPSKRQKLPKSAEKGKAAQVNAPPSVSTSISTSQTQPTNMGRSHATSHIRSSNRIRKPTTRLITAMTTESFLVPQGAVQGEIYSVQVLFPDHQE